MSPCYSGHIYVVYSEGDLNRKGSMYLSDLSQSVIVGSNHFADVKCSLNFKICSLHYKLILFNKIYITYSITVTN